MKKNKKVSNKVGARWLLQRIEERNLVMSDVWTVLRLLNGELKLVDE